MFSNDVSQRIIMLIFSSCPGFNEHTNHKHKLYEKLIEQSSFNNHQINMIYIHFILASC